MTNINKFPRLHCTLDRRKKLMDIDIKEIRYLNKRNVAIHIIAKKYKVSISLIRYWTNEKSRKKIRKQAAQYKHDDEWKKRHKKISRESTKYRRKVNPLLLKYSNTLKKRSNIKKI